MSMVGSSDGGGGSLPGSPRNRVKFLCSHGGKILPRPADGQLKYVGGETRVISVPRDITFPELMKKLTYLIDCDMLLKYQLMPEDLDALVSVKSDEDLRHMFEEYDRHEVHGYPRLRTFLFPANPIIIENQLGSMDRHTLEQRYINSINGIVHPSYKPPPPINVSHASFTISSACSSPRSPTPESCPTDGSSNHDSNYYSGRSSLHRIQSSPSMYNLIGGQQSQTSSSSPQIHHYHYYQQQPGRHHQTALQHHHQTLHKPPLDRSYHGPEQLLKVRSVGRAESSRYQVDQQSSPCRAPSRGGSMCCTKCLNYDDYGHYGNTRVERAESYLGSPSLPQSPRQGYATKAWD